MIYTLLIFLCVIFIIIYYIFESDVFQPAIIVCAVYILSVLCAIYNIENWQIDLHFNTFCAIISGIIIFSITSIIIHAYFYRFKKKKNV